MSETQEATVERALYKLPEAAAAGTAVESGRSGMRAGCTTGYTAHWYAVNRFDVRAVALYERHYSCRQYADGRKRTQIAPPGSPLVLLTTGADALFGWLKNSVERFDGQEGINCFVFRNESPVLSSDLIREADELAWAKWPGERHFTYVDPKRTRRKRDPGRCFLRAGWRVCGESKGGLVILERVSTERDAGGTS